MWKKFDTRVFLSTWVFYWDQSVSTSKFCPLLQKKVKKKIYTNRKVKSFTFKRCPSRNPSSTMCDQTETRVFPSTWVCYWGQFVSTSKSCPLLNKKSFKGIIGVKFLNLSCGFTFVSLFYNKTGWSICNLPGSSDKKDFLIGEKTEKSMPAGSTISAPQLQQHTALWN